MTAAEVAVSSTAARLLDPARFEVVPVRGVEDHLPHLPTGATVTVTSSPRRGLEPTLALSEELAGRGFNAVPHLAARLFTGQSEVAGVAARLASAGIREVFVVGGDATSPAGPFESALSLLSAMDGTAHRFERVGIAGYPEPHPLVDEGSLTQALRAKEPLAAYVVTQICYDAGTVIDWIAGLPAMGVRLPVRIGVPGAVARSRLLDVSLKVGVGDSIRFLRRRGAVARRLLRTSTFRPDTLVRELSARLEAAPLNVLGFHVNTFNQVEATERWRRDMLAAGSTS